MTALQERIEVLEREKGRLEEELQQERQANQGLEQVCRQAKDKIQEMEVRLEQGQVAWAKLAEEVGEERARVKKVQEVNEVLKTELEDEQQKSADLSSNLKQENVKLRFTEERVANLVVEKAALQKNSDEWKRRFDQLVEKINPEELKSLQEDKDKERMVCQVLFLQQEQEGLLEQVASLQTELQTTRLFPPTGGDCERPKSVALPGVVQQEEGENTHQPRKQQQPQDHPEPHVRTTNTRTPRDKHGPMAQHVTSQAVVLPTSQVSPGQLEVTTAQPTVTVSLSVSSTTEPSQHTSASQPPQPVNQDAGALEFYPRSSEAVVLQQEDAAMPRAVVIMRQDQSQASTSGPLAAPGGSCTSGAPQRRASPSTATTASVLPALKRPREQVVADSDSQKSTEGGGADGGIVGGMQKKAGTKRNKGEDQKRRLPEEWKHIEKRLKQEKAGRKSKNTEEQHQTEEKKPVSLEQPCQLQVPPALPALILPSSPTSYTGLPGNTGKCLSSWRSSARNTED